MRKKIGLFIIALLFICVYISSIFAEDNPASSPLVTRGVKNQSVFGSVGKVDYVDFKSRGDSSLVLKDKKGESVKVYLKELKTGATVLTTYRKEKDKKGREKNVLISLSIVRTAGEMQESKQKK